MANELAIPETKEIGQKITTLSDRAMQFHVVDDTSLIIADTIKSECLAMRKVVTTFFAPLKEKAFAAHKALTTAETVELNKIVPGENHIKQEMARYQMEQRKKRKDEEARLLKEAQAREEEERIARAAEIEREAAALKASGQVEEAVVVQQEAEQVLATPAYVPPPRMAAPPKTKNVLKMIVDRDRIQGIVYDLNNKAIFYPPLIPGVRFFQEWNFEVFAPSHVPDEYRKPL